jgi:hypothetical protein
LIPDLRLRLFVPTVAEASWACWYDRYCWSYALICRSDSEPNLDANSNSSKADLDSMFQLQIQKPDTGII